MNVTEPSGRSTKKRLIFLRRPSPPFTRVESKNSRPYPMQRPSELDPINFPMHFKTRLGKFGFHFLTASLLSRILLKTMNTLLGLWIIWIVVQGFLIVILGLFVMGKRFIVFSTEDMHPGKPNRIIY
jgi:hypothetical protein